MRWAWLACFCCTGCEVDAFSAPPVSAQSDAIGVTGELAVKAESSAPSQLSLAAIYVEKKDYAKACDYFTKFLQAHPDHFEARFYYAEALLKQCRYPEARIEFERSIADSQQVNSPDYSHLVQCHGRLLVVADGLEDEYLAHMHRGIGMYRLAQEYRQLDDPEEQLSIEGILCKAAGELNHACRLRPREARPAWYLYAVWRDLGQQQLAKRWLAETSRSAPFSYLTPAEQSQLQLACQK